VPQGRILRSVLMKPETEQYVPWLHEQVLDLLELRSRSANPE
jgi:hypothetical protein